MVKMDRVDRDQQDLIDALIRRDKEHDEFIISQKKLDSRQDKELIWIKASSILIVIFAILMTAIVFYTLDKATPKESERIDWSIK